MPRRTGDDLNELKIQDNISNSEIVLYFRMPTTQEQVCYTNGLIRRAGKKIENRQGEMRMKYGAEILQGFRTGDFEKKVDGKWRPYASDTASEQYDPDWKQLVCAHAPDLVELLAVHVFERPAVVDSGEEDENEKN